MYVAYSRPNAHIEPDIFLDLYNKTRHSYKCCV